MFLILAGLGLIILTGGNKFALLVAVFHLLWLLMLIGGIYGSARRWMTAGAAIGAFALVCILGVIATFILVPAGSNTIDVNEVLDKIGLAVTVFAPIAALLAVGMTKPRTKT